MRLLRKLSVPSEVCIVLMLCFGLWAYASIYSLAALLKGLRLQHPWITDHTGLLLALFQIVALVLVALIACSRGWSIREFGFRASWKLAGIGCGLALLVAVAFVGLGFDRIFAFKGSIGVLTLLVLSVANSVFEEAIEVGYLTRVLSHYGMWTTVLASTSLRVFLHVHGGIQGMLGCLVLGIVYGCIYWRYRQLLPLVLPHAVLTAIALIPITRGVH
jgi:hypothetical protein